MWIAILNLIVGMYVRISAINLIILELIARVNVINYYNVGINVRLFAKK